MMIAIKMHYHSLAVLWIFCFLPNIPSIHEFDSHQFLL
ncbi:hypothetical protein yfred0001_38050 [Yersinia frederiksenii ATCC 33641]|nr:hypothetical protein yfred0001_38050 [Yersinia frederiksenii ATCC 33641]